MNCSKFILLKCLLFAFANMMSMSIIVQFSSTILQSLAILAKVLPSISLAPPENLLKISLRSFAGAGGTTSRFADHSLLFSFGGVRL